MSRLRRLVLSDRFFFVTCRLARHRQILGRAEFSRLAQVIDSRRQQHHFPLTAWVFLPDHWHAIFFPRYPVTISRVMETIKVSSTRQINRRQGERGLLWQGRFFDRALRTVREYYEKVEYLHLNPVTAGLVSRAEDWPSSSVFDYTESLNAPTRPADILAIDRLLLPADERARI